MAYAKYNLNGREMLNLDNLGMVDYDEYYSIFNKSYERRENISNKYTVIQNANILENEPSIDSSVLYQRFLEELKSINPEMYNQKSTLLKNYLNELKEEEKIFKEEKKQLLSKGYPFNEDLKRYGYYIIEINNNYFQYKLVTTENVKIDMGDKLFPQTANISRYEFVPITIIDLLQIKKKILSKNTFNAHYRAKIQGLFEENITKKTK